MSHNLSFPPKSRAFLPTSCTNCPDGYHFTRMGSHFAQNTTTNPFSLFSSLKHLSGIFSYKTPPIPSQNTPFPGLNLKVGKMNYSWGKLDPNWAKCSKRRQNFSRSGPEKIVHLYLSVYSIYVLLAWVHRLVQKVFIYIYFCTSIFLSIPFTFYQYTDLYKTYLY